MNNKHSIEVREVEIGSEFDSSAPFKAIGSIRRVLRVEQSGNFNPVFCCYNGDNRALVHSELGDISDPFRANESYLEKLFIRVEKQ